MAADLMPALTPGPLGAIARLVGHRGTVVTEAVYRKQLRPVITEGAERMDQVFRMAPEVPPTAIRIRFRRRAISHAVAEVSVSI